MAVWLLLTAHLRVRNYLLLVIRSVQISGICKYAMNISYSSFERGGAIVALTASALVWPGSELLSIILDALVTSEEDSEFGVEIILIQVGSNIKSVIKNQ
jgi:hypothetical protein